MGKLRKIIAPICIQNGRNNTHVRHSKRWNLLETDENEGTLIVVLTKGKKDKSFGLTISGGADRDELPYISHIKPGALAEQSGYFSCEDEILEVCKCNVTSLNHDDIIKLVQDAGLSLELKIQYKLSKQVEVSMRWGKSFILANKVKTGVDFTLKGGQSKDGKLTRPCRIASVKQKSELESILFPGDRVLTINHQPINDLHLSSVNQLIEQTEQDVLLEVQYQAEIGSSQENLEEGTCVIEVSLPNSRIRTGITLNVSFDYEERGSSIIISDIEESTIVDRCGYVFVNDLVLSINNIPMEGITLPEATQILEETNNVLKMVVMRTEHSRTCESISISDQGVSPSRIIAPYSTEKSLSTSSSSDVTIHAINGYIANSVKSNGHLGNNNRKGKLPKNRAHSLDSEKRQLAMSLSNKRRALSYSTNTTGLIEYSARGQRSRTLSDRKRSYMKQLTPLGSLHSMTSSVLRTFSTYVSSQTEILRLVSDVKDTGIEVADGVLLNGNKFLVITEIEKNGIFESHGGVQIGDRIVSINGIQTDYMTSQEFHEVFNETELPLNFEIEFDVSDSVIPNEGSFTVKIRQHFGRIGISVKQPGPSAKEKYLRIADIVKGGPAYRLGMLACGDQILSVNGRSTSHMEPYEFNDLVRGAAVPIQLTFRKDEEILGATFTIELASHGEPLGISLTGSEYPFEPIVIGGVSEKGQAYKCNAFQVGDQLLAINEISLRGRTLSEACELLKLVGTKIKFLVKRTPKEEIVKTPSDPEPQVWTWSGKEPVHVVNHASSISMIFEKAPTSGLCGRKIFLHSHSSNTSLSIQQICFQSCVSASEHLPTYSSSSSSSGSDFNWKDENKRYLNRKKYTRTRSSNSNSHSGLQLNSRSSSRNSVSNTISLLEQEVINAVNSTRVSNTTPLSSPRKSLYRSRSVSPYVISPASENVGIAALLKHAMDEDDHSVSALNNFDNQSPNLKRSISGSDADSNLNELTSVLGNAGKPQAYFESKYESTRGSLKSLKLNQIGLHGKNINTTSRFKVEPVKEYQKDTRDEMVTSNVENNLMYEPFGVTVSQYNSIEESSETTGSSSPSETYAFFPVRMEKYRLPNLGKSFPNTEYNAGPIVSHTEDALQKGISGNPGSAKELQNFLSIRSPTGTRSIKTIELKKENPSDKFGFSVADSVNDKGAYVKSIEEGSLAHTNGGVQKYDRILKVNGVYTGNMACDDLVPLLQKAGMTLELVIERIRQDRTF